MFRIKSLFLVTTLVIGGCSDLPHEAPFDPDSPAERQARGSLTGLVSLEGESDAANVVIRLENDAVSYDTVTTNDGSFRLTGVVPGSYSLTIATRGYEAVEQMVILDLGQALTLQPLRLKLARVVVNGAALVERQTANGLVSSGGVQITLRRMGSARQAPSKLRSMAGKPTAETLTLSTISSPDGTYSVDGVPSGTYEIEASTDDASRSLDPIEVDGTETVTVPDTVLRPVSGFFIIEGEGAAGKSELYTRDSEVMLTLSGFEAVTQAIGRSADGTAASCQYDAPAPASEVKVRYALGVSTAGTQVICVRFFDENGKGTDHILGSILYDPAEPQLPSLRINDGAEYVGSPIVSLKLGAVDVASGLYGFEVTSDPAVFSAVTEGVSSQTDFPFLDSKVETLPCGDGPCTLWARYLDKAGNWSDAVSATVVLSTATPSVTGGIVDAEQNAIGSGAITNKSRLYLSSTAVTHPTPLEMQISTTGSFASSAWEPYSGWKAIDLQPPPGASAEARPIAARVRDKVGRMTDILTGFEVSLDTRGPEGTIAVPSLHNSLTVPATLALTQPDPDAYVALSSNQSFSGSVLTGFQPSLNHTLTDDRDGLHTIYARFSDPAGNLSPVVSAVVNIDRTPPELGSIRIAQGELTNLQTVNLELFAVDAKQMAVSEGACGSNWQDFATARSLTFATADNEMKTVSVRYRDAAGNVTQCYAQAVTYDTVPPAVAAPQVRINNGAAYARDRVVTVDLGVDPDDATAMQLAESVSFAGSAWVPVTTTTSLSLSAGDAPKTIYARFRDGAGNIAGPYDASIILDTLPPEQPQLTVEDGTGYARQTTVAVVMGATGAPAFYRATTSGSIDDGTWKSYATSTQLQLPGGADGLRSVAMQFKDLAGNLSSVVSANVYLDRNAPSSPSLSVDDGAPYTNDNFGSVQLALAANENGSGLDDVILASTEAGLSTAPKLPFEPTKLYTLSDPGVEGVKEVYVSYGDKAGNYSQPVSRSIILDRTEPTGTLTAGNGGLQSSFYVEVTISADPDTAQMWLSNESGFAQGTWESFSETTVWLFPAVAGEHTLYGKFKDEAGNVSGTYSVVVTIDTSAPPVHGVSANIVSDTIVWEHFGTDVTGYSVVIYNPNGTALSVTETTETSLYVTKLHPGMSVIAHYADGTSSRNSYPPSYYVPATIDGFVGLHASEKDNAAIASAMQTYGLGTTTGGCGHVNVVLYKQEYLWDQTLAAGSLPCGRGHTLYLMQMNWGYGLPPFTGVTVATENNPLAGYPIRIGGGKIPNLTYYDDRVENLEPYLLTPVPDKAKWPLGPKIIYEQLPVVEGSAFDPATARGENVFFINPPLLSLAMSDDVTATAVFYDGAVTADPYLGEGPITWALSGQFAGINVATATYRYDYGTHLTFNNLWNGESDNTSSYDTQPGSIRFSYLNYGQLLGDSVALSDMRYQCDYSVYPYACNYRGNRFIVDPLASQIQWLSNSTYSYGSEFRVPNADASREYVVRIGGRSKGEFTWTDEWEQPAFGPFLKRMLSLLGAPTRVRGTGSPVLRSDVPDAVELRIASTEDMSGAAWQPYASEVTLPDGSTRIYVQYRDAAGNLTEVFIVDVKAPATAPRVDAVSISGPGASPGFSTTRDVSASISGEFESDVRVRVSQDPNFADDGWQVLGDANEVSITLPNQVGKYWYYFWLADGSNNFSLPVSASVLYDGTPPTAEFSVRPGNDAGTVDVQIRWTVTTRDSIPSLINATVTTATKIQLPFEFPYQGATSSVLRFHSSDRACANFDGISFAACPLGKLMKAAERRVEIAPAFVRVFWISQDGYGTPITVGVTLRDDGSVSLAYWDTRAKTPMAGYVDTVDTPYSDWAYALVNGSVDYTPNAEDIYFMLATEDGGSYRIDPPPPNGMPGYPSSTWQTIAVAERGQTTFTGTAYSAGGAAGRVSERGIVIRDASLSPPSALGSAPISDGRYWAYWRSDDEKIFELRDFQVDQNATVAGAYNDQMQVAPLATGSYYSSQRFTLPKTFRLHRDGTVDSSGTPVSVDLRENMLYGADGSLWDIRNPAKPTAFKTVGGTWPGTPGTAARFKDEVWAGSGIWDISSPDSPVKITEPSLTGSAFAQYQGRVYAINNGQLTVYDGETRTLVFWTGSAFTGPMWIQGSYLGVGRSTSVYIYSLANPDAPSLVTSLTGGVFGTKSAGNVYTSSRPLAVAGGVSVWESNGNLIPRLLDLETGFNDVFSVNALAAAGPWVWAAGADGGLLSAHFGAALPGKVNVATSDTSAVVAVDADYYYICDDSQLSWYTHGAVLAGSAYLSSCSSEMHVDYPYVWLGTYSRYRISGSSLVADSTQVCPPEYTYCPDAGRMGTGFSVNGRWWPSLEREVAFEEDNCRVVAADGDMVLCASSGSSPKTVSGTTYSRMLYSGISEGPHTLPLVPLLRLNNTWGLSFSNGILANDSEVFHIASLAVTSAVGQSLSLSLLGGDLARDGSGNVYRVDRFGVRQVANVPDTTKLALGPTGLFVASGWKNTRLGKFGPAAPEHRKSFTTHSGASFIVSGGGYVYLGDGAGVTRLGALERTASRSSSAGGHMVHHRDGKFTVYGTTLYPAMSTEVSSSTTVDHLCTSILKRDDPYSQAVCSAYSTAVTAGALLEGDLGEYWWSLKEPVDDSIGAVTALAVGESEKVYAGTQAGGVYVYDPYDDVHAAAANFAVFGSVNSLAEDRNRLFVQEGGTRLAARDLTATGYPELWSISLSNLYDVEAAGGHLVYRYANTLQRVEPETGALIKSCNRSWNFTPDFALMTWRWSGQSHPIAVLAYNSWLYFVDLETCNTLAMWAYDGSIVSVDVVGNLLLIGLSDGRLWITSMANYPEKGMSTVLDHENETTQAIILGRHVYTIGSQAPMLFDLH